MVLFSLVSQMNTMSMIGFIPHVPASTPALQKESTALSPQSTGTMKWEGKKGDDSSTLQLANGAFPSQLFRTNIWTHIPIWCMIFPSGFVIVIFFILMLLLLATMAEKWPWPRNQIWQLNFQQLYVLWVFPFLFKMIDWDLKGREKKREGRSISSNFPSTGLLHKWPKGMRMNQKKTRSLEVHQGLMCGHQVPLSLGHFPLQFQECYQWTELEMEPQALYLSSNTEREVA